jgi:beta-glucosidase
MFTRSLSLLALCTAPLASLWAAPLPTSLDAEAIERQIDALLDSMSVEEKIGQIQQHPGHLDGAYLEAAIRSGAVGSVLNVIEPERLRELQRIAVEESPSGIPLIIGRDVIHGFRTIAPIPLGLSATWNPDLVEETAAAAASEARSIGIHWTFAPMIDVTRDPRWGRVAESPGEDAYLTTVMGVAMIHGFQGDDLSAPDRLAACAKHFAGYGASQGGRDYNTTWIPDQQLWDVYLPPFEAAVDAGVATFMTAFNDLNGMPCSGSAFLLDEVLRQRWDFEGMVVSDWASVTQMIAHGVAGDERRTAELAIEAGVDMEMSSRSMLEHFPEFLESGRFSEAKLDGIVANILRVKLALGLFENPYAPDDAVYPPAITPSARALALRAAAESAVLLKNDNRVLPLSEGQRVAVIGPLADAPADQLGTWSFDGLAEDSITPRAAFAQLAEAGRLTVNYAPGLRYSRDHESSGFAAALEAAEASDVVLFFAGEEAILSGEAHSRAFLDLPGAQNELLAQLAETGKPIVLVVMAGRPLTLEPIFPLADAVLYAWHPGTMAGPGLAEVLMGDTDASGRLPITFPRAVGQIPIFHGHRNTGRPFNPDSWTQLDDIPVGAPQTSLGNETHYLDLGHEPQFWFGEGLSYTTFEFSAPELSSPVLRPGESVEVSAIYTNTGDRPGYAVAQLYFRDPVASITRPVSELCAFEKFLLEPGESRRVTFTLTTDDFTFSGPDGAPRLEAGQIELKLGTSSRDTANVELQIEL